MVKNLPSIERSTKIRLGKYIPEDQANNTIIFNATDALLPDTSTSNSTYIAPIRGKGDSESGTFNVLAYKPGTHEIVDTKLTTDEVGNKSLQDVTNVGSTTTQPVGLSNTNPQDTLSIGNRIFINKSSSDYGIKITDQGKLLIDGVSNGNEVQVSGTVHANDFTGSHIGLSNTEPTDSISIGNEGQTILNVPSESVYALKTSGNLYAQNYIGDGGLLSNVTLQSVTDKSNVTSNTLLLTNPTTSLHAYSNITVDGKILGEIHGSNAITASTITGTVIESVGGVFKGNGSQLSDLNASNIQVGTLSTSLLNTQSGTTGDIILDVGPTITSGKLTNVTDTEIVYAGSINDELTSDSDFVYIHSDKKLKVNKLEVATDLKVLGTFSNIQSEHVIIKDAIIQLGDGTENVDSGMIFARTPATDNVYVGYDQTESELAIGFTDNKAADSSITVKDNVDFNAKFYGNVETRTVLFDDNVQLKAVNPGKSFKVVNAIKLDPNHESPSNNVLSFDTATGEIYDSGGQGGSTLANIIEEGSNVAIGPSVASANLTVNTYGSNVLTVTGNVSADNITIGALTVAASPFNLDDVASAGAGANVTSNVIQFTATGNAFVTTNNIKIGKDVHAGGNVYSQNLQLTNTQITASFTSGSGTITIDAKNKSYGTAPLISIDADVAILDVTNLPNGGQVVVPLLATGAARKVLKTITTGIDFIAFTSDVSIDQDSHGLLTVSKIGASGAEKIYMNAISFAVA